MDSIPNLLGFARVAMAPAIFLLILQSQWPAAFWLFVIAGLSDAFDGYIARWLDATSDFGRFLDPFADKILMNLTYIALGMVALLPSWLVALVFLRDFLLGVTASVNRSTGRQVPPPPLRISKTNTGLQIFLAALVLAIHAFQWQLQQAVTPLVIIVGATTLLSGLAYLGNMRSKAPS